MTSVYDVSTDVGGDVEFGLRTIVHGGARHCCEICDTIKIRNDAVIGRISYCY